VGHIFALASITATTGATVQGQLVARNGAVTLDHNTIMNGICAIIPVTTPVVTPPAIVTSPAVGTPTIPGQLPKTGTGTPWYEVLLMGAAIMLVGAVGLRRKHVMNKAKI
jgi:LPXTG-motif cell wall-anchored protein